MTPVRVGLLGARRARQGLGPFLARDLRAAGAQVPCFLVHRETSLGETREQLRRVAGAEPRGYTSLPALLAGEELDALAICSPHESHAGFLEAAVDAGLHALCEKPLVWGESGLARRAATLAAAFEMRGLVLWENCQWPYALPAFERLHPGSLAAPPRHFAMHLQPAGHGARMLGDSLPHVFSLLQRLAPGEAPAIGEVAFSSTDPAPDQMEVRFRYLAGGASVECRVELRPTRQHPREVGLALDGRSAIREVSSPDYRLSFVDGDRRIAFDDPMARLAADFVAACERGDRGPDAARRRREIVDRTALLEQACAAWERAAG